jgi:predicted permease
MAMFLMCGGVLFLACLNLMSLLMARSVAREHEFATRLALGGTRKRLIQQLLIESMLIAVLGTVTGLATASALSKSLGALLMSGSSIRNIDLHLDTSLDARVLGFAALIAVLSTLIVGLLPALRATTGNLSEQIKEGQVANQTRKQSGFLPRLLLSTEVALALTLVIGAGLLATSLTRLIQSGVGFDTRNLVNITFSMDKQPLRGDALMRLYQDIGEQLRRQPGVTDVSFETIVPLSRLHWNRTFAAHGQDFLLLQLNGAAPDYFSTMRIPIHAGREFRWSDTKASGRKIILNETAARQLFPGANAVGQQVYSKDKVSYEVTAVVGDAKYNDVRSPAPATGYIPVTQDDANGPSLTAVVRINGPLGPLASAARSITARLAPTAPAPLLITVEEIMNRSMSAEQMMAFLSVFFAGCALLVMGIGLYGTLAYMTARRTTQIGIRMALGAKRSSVVGMIFRENLLIATVGSFIGFVAALLGSRAIASFLYGTSDHDPWVLVGSLTALILVASAASLIPAFRAARISPLIAIRYE